jgi:hypothetical protein
MQCRPLAEQEVRSSPATSPFHSGLRFARCWFRGAIWWMLGFSRSVCEGAPRVSRRHLVALFFFGGEKCDPAILGLFEPLLLSGDWVAWRDVMVCGLWLASAASNHSGALLLFRFRLC